MGLQRVGLNRVMNTFTIRDIIYYFSFFLGVTSLTMRISRYIHVTENGPISLFLMVEQYSIVYMYHIFIHSSINGCLGCFYVLAMVNNAAMNIQVH